MHHQLDSLRLRILVQFLDIEIRIRCHEVEYIVLVAVRPIFPSFVPTLHKNLIETMLGSEINITAHLLVVCRVTSVRSSLRIVGLAELDRREVVCIVP